MDVGSFNRVRYGSDESQRRADQAHARAAKTQRCEYGVAPGVSVMTVSGIRQAGDEVRMEDFGSNAFLARRLLQRLVDHRAVIHRAQAPKDARFVVGPKALTSRKGVLSPGEAIEPEHMEQEDLLELVRRGAVIDRGSGGAPEGGGPQAA